MDERQKRILASLVAGSALSLTLGVTASAEEVTNTEIQESISQTNEVGSTTETGGTGSTGTGTTDTNGTGTTGSTGTGTTDTNGTGTTETNGTGTTGSTGTGSTGSTGTGSTGSTETGTTDTNGTGTTGSTETGGTDINGTGGTDTTGTGSTNTPEGGNANEGGSTDGNDSTDEGSSTDEGNSTPEGTVTSEPVTYTTPETTPAETGTTPPVVTVKNGALTSGDENWDAENKAGLRFDEASGSVVMVNNSNAVTIQTDSKGVNLSVAGVNRISTLYADGNVNITGTGIVLIDSIDMLEGTNLNLLTNTNIYTEGSAAVFLKTGEGVYQLINGEVSGILDEEYTIPDGVMLVVPEGGTLDMRVTTTVTTTTDGTQTETHCGFTEEEEQILVSGTEEEKKIFTGGVQQEGVLVQKSVIFSTPKLNIAANSILHIQEGGQMLMNAFRNETLGVVNSSTLEVSGILGLDGKIRAYQGSGVGQAENFYLNVKDGGSVCSPTGKGTMSGVTAVYETGAGKDDTLNITGDGSYVKINNGGIANLNTTDKTGVVFDDGDSIGSVTATEGGSVTFYATDYTAQMQVEEIDGDYSISSGYVKVGNGFAKENFKPAENGIPFLSNGGVMGQKESSVARLEFWKNMSTLGQGSSFWKSGTLTGFGSNIDYSYLSGNAATKGFDYYEVFVQDGDDIKLYLLDKNSTQTLSAGNICQIRGVNFNSKITVGNEILNGSSDSGWTSGSTGSGWRYDGSNFSMVNNGTAVDIKADGKGMNFSVAGLNRIGTLYADADVNFTGTGIVLIDSLDLKNGAHLNLLNINGVYESGSAAVFLKNASGEYVLINGSTPGVSVPGILDETYTIPDGVTLVVPKDGILDMRVTTSVTTTTTVEKNGTTTTDTETHYGITQEDKNNIAAFKEPQQTGYTEGEESWTTTVSKSIGFTVPELNISSRATLRIQQGAQLLMQAFKDCITNFNRSSTLNVFGKLELDGQMTATGDSQNGNDANLRVNVKSGGSVKGTGTITNATIRYEAGAGKQDQLNIAGDGNLIDLNSSGIGTLNVKGKANLYYADNVTMGSVSVDNSGDNQVTFYAKDVLNRLYISDSLTGSYTISSGYLTVAGNYANESITPPTEGTSITTKVCPPGVNGGVLYTKLGQYDTIYYCTGTNTANYSNVWEGRDPYSESTISWDKLTSALGSLDVFEVFTSDAAGNVTVHLFSKDQGGTMSTSGVFLIRGFTLAILPTNESGDGAINSGTSNTGSGVLGGGNAGSFNGGSASGVWNGDRDSQTGGQNDTLTGTNTGSTGSGVLGGGSSLVGGKPVGVLGGTRKPPAPPTTPATPDTPQEASQPDAPKQETSEYDLVLKITGSGTEYDLKAFYDGIELKELGGGTVTVELEAQLDPGWNPNDLFAVFRDEQGKLVAVRVRYDARTGKLAFDAPMLGRFRLVYLDWDGTDYESEAFLAAILAAL